MARLLLAPGRFLTYAVNISNPIKRLTRVIGNIQKALAAAQRVFMIIDMPEEIAESRMLSNCRKSVVKWNFKMFLCIQ